jgi:hypothetical protein
MTTDEQVRDRLVLNLLLDGWRVKYVDHISTDKPNWCLYGETNHARKTVTIRRGMSAAKEARILAHEALHAAEGASDYALKHGPSFEARIDQILADIRREITQHERWTS